jgi:hypothetical protein
MKKEKMEKNIENGDEENTPMLPQIPTEGIFVFCSGN